MPCDRSDNDRSDRANAPRHLTLGWRGVFSRGGLPQSPHAPRGAASRGRENPAAASPLSDRAGQTESMGRQIRQPGASSGS